MNPVLAFRRCSLGVAMVALLAGCAQLPQRAETDRMTLLRPQAPVESVQLGGVLTRDAGASAWLNSGVQLRDPLGLVRYKAEYRIEGGDLLTDADAAPTVFNASRARLGGDMLQQSLETRLPSLIGGAPRLSFTREAGSSWTVTGESLRRTERAQLVWEPSALGVQLNWQAPRVAVDPNAPLDCVMGGRFNLNLDRIGLGDQALQLGARGCDIDAPDRVAAGLRVGSWSTAWQFGPQTLRNTLAFTLLETTPSAAFAETEAPVALADSASGYELKLSQTRSQGLWIGSSAVGVRHVVDAQGLDITDWTAQAQLQRRINTLALTAGWQRAADPLWFVPGVARTQDQLSVGIDLASYLTRVWGLPPLFNSSLSYRWTESADAATSGGGVYWKLNARW